MFQKTCFLAGTLLAATSTLSYAAEEVAVAAPQAAAVTEAAAPAAKYSEEQLIEVFGYFSAFQAGFTAFGFGPEDAAAINKGVSQALGDEEPSAEMIAIVQSPEFQAFIQPRAQAAQQKAQEAQAAQQAAQEEAAATAAADNIEAGKAFIEGLKDDEGVQSTESGLYYKIITAGGETKPTLSDKVLVHYKGTRIDGTQFDSSYDRGEPVTFPLNGVVKGFGEGLTKIGAGGKIILYIPSELGYGNSPRPGGVIQPGDTLVFECELIEINPGS